MGGFTSSWVENLQQIGLPKFRKCSKNLKFNQKNMISKQLQLILQARNQSKVIL
jgi:hypothetical protein